MHIQENDLIDLVVKSTARVAAESGAEPQSGISRKTELFGGDSTFDSLMIVSLIVDLEGALEKSYGVRVALAGERAMAEPVNPFSTVETLASFAGKLIRES